MLGVKKDNRASHTAATERGFTLVELLIVIVVIAILATISIVSYNSIQQRARVSTLTSSLKQAAKKVAVYEVTNNAYPTDLSATGIENSGAVTYSYSQTANDFCITALYNGIDPHNITSDMKISTGPCDGQSGGGSYCPNDSHVPLNGFYCDGAEGATATGQTGVVKLSATASGVPAGAPGAFVGRQGTRDAYLGNAFPVSAGEVYCVEGWVATNDSAVQHQIGLQLSGPSMSNNWINGGAVTMPSSTWKKLSGCITIPGTGFNSARVWTQNNGTNGTTASPYWYQTAIKLRKQS